MGIRETLSQPVLDMLGDFILLTKEDKDEILEHQAKLLALHTAQKEAPEFAQKDLCKAPRYGKNNSLMLEAEMTRLSVTVDDVRKARKMVVSQKGMPPEVPLIGKIATDLEYIEADFLEALIKGQAGSAILQAATRLRDRDFYPEKRHFAIVERHDAGQIARNYIGKYNDDSDALVSAQAFLHLVYLLGSLFEVGDDLPANWIEICDICDSVGYACLQACAEHMAALGHLSDARDIYMTIPEEAEPHLHNDTLDPFLSLLQERVDYLSDNGGLKEDEVSKVNHLLKRRIGQIDLSTLMNVNAQHEDIDLKERLRMRLSAAKSDE